MEDLRIPASSTKQAGAGPKSPLYLPIPRRSSRGGDTETTASLDRTQSRSVIALRTSHTPLAAPHPPMLPTLTAPVLDAPFLSPSAPSLCPSTPSPNTLSNTTSPNSPSPNATSPSPLSVAAASTPSTSASQPRGKQNRPRRSIPSLSADIQSGGESKEVKSGDAARSGETKSSGDARSSRGPRNSMRSSAVDSDSQFTSGGHRIPPTHSSARSDSVPFSWSESPLEEDLARQSFGSLGNLWPDPPLEDDGDKDAPQESPQPTSSPRDGASPTTEEEAEEDIRSEVTECWIGRQKTEAPSAETEMADATFSVKAPSPPRSPLQRSPRALTHLQSQTGPQVGQVSGPPVGETPRSNLAEGDATITSGKPKEKKRKTSIFRKLQSLGHFSGLGHEGRSLLLSSRRSSAVSTDTKELGSTGDAVSSPRLPSTKIILSLASILVGGGNKSHSPRPPGGSSAKTRTPLESGIGEAPFVPNPMDVASAGSGGADLCLPSPGSKPGGDETRSSGDGKSSGDGRSSGDGKAPRRGPSLIAPWRRMSTGCPVQKTAVLPPAATASPPGAPVGHWHRYGSEPAPIKRRASWKDESMLEMLSLQSPPCTVLGGDPLAPIRESGIRSTSTAPASHLSEFPEPGWSLPLQRKHQRAFKILSAKLLPEITNSESFRLSLEHHYGKKNALCRYANKVNKVVIYKVDEMKAIFSFGPSILASPTMISQQAMPLYMYTCSNALAGKSQDVWRISAKDSLLEGIPLPYETCHKSLVVSLPHEAHSFKELDSLTALYGMLSRFSSCPKLYCRYDDNRTTHLVFEYLEGLSLPEYLETHHRVVADDTCHAIIRDLLQFVAFTHRRQMIIRNLRPESFIVVDDDDDSFPNLTSDAEEDVTFVTAEEEVTTLEEETPAVNETRDLEGLTAGIGGLQRKHGLRLCLTDLSGLCHFDEASSLPPEQPQCNFCAPEMLISKKVPFMYHSQADIFSLGQLISLLLTGRVVFKSGAQHLRKRSPRHWFNNDGFCKDISKSWQVGVLPVRLVESQRSTNALTGGGTRNGRRHAVSDEPSVPQMRSDLSSEAALSSRDSPSAAELLSSGIRSVLMDNEIPDNERKSPWAPVAATRRLPPDWRSSEFVAFQLPFNTGWKSMSPLALNLVVRMVTIDPQLRFSAAACLRHAFVSQHNQNSPHSLHTTGSMSLSFSHEKITKLETKYSATTAAPARTITMPSKLRPRLLSHLFLYAVSDTPGTPKVGQPSTRFPLIEEATGDASEDGGSLHTWNHTAVSSDDTLLAEIEAASNLSDNEHKTIQTETLMSGVRETRTRQEGESASKPTPHESDKSRFLATSLLHRNSSLGNLDHRMNQTADLKTSSSRSRRGSQLLTVVAHSFKQLFGDSHNTVEHKGSAPGGDLFQRRIGTPDNSCPQLRRHSLAVGPAVPTNSANPVAQLAEFLETRKRMKAVAAKLAAQESTDDSEPAPPPTRTPPTVSVSVSVTEEAASSGGVSSTTIESGAADPKAARARRALEGKNSRLSAGETPSPPAVSRVTPELFIPSPERYSRRASCAALIQPVEYGSPILETAVPQRRLSRPYPSFSEARRPALLRGSTDAQLPPPRPRILGVSGTRAGLTVSRSLRPFPSQDSPGATCSSSCLASGIKKDKASGSEIPMGFNMLDEDTQTHDILLLDAYSQTTESRIERFHKATQTEELEVNDVGCDPMCSA